LLSLPALQNFLILMLQQNYRKMAKHLPSRPTIIFLIATLLLFYSYLFSEYSVQKTTGNEWQEPEQLEASDSMRMTDRDVAKANQYPYMVS
jgi:hypothetical protein